MRRSGVWRRAGWGVALAAAGALSGCQSNRPAPQTAVDLFVPKSMRIHPVFTQVADVTGSGHPDGVKAQLEFDDQFGDPTKAAGQVLFELYEYRRQPPFTGRREIAPFVASLATADDQRARWNKTLRTYLFQLDYPGLNPGQDYVLQATFELTGGGRFVNQIVLSGHKGATKSTAGGLGPLGL